MSEKIIQLNEGVIKNELKELVRSSVEETLNGLLEVEANQFTNAAKYERLKVAKATAAAITAGTSPRTPGTSRLNYQS